MSSFYTFLRLGFEHISDLKGYDHILFVTALAAVYPLQAWRQLVWLVTAFTVGHSLTLALATLRLIDVPTDLIEFLIPVTIIFTCLVNMLCMGESTGERNWLKYAGATFFGLIHGLGFSNFLRQILGAEENLLGPLFAFNLGLEIGQLFIVAVALGFSFVIVDVLKTSRREWNLVLSGGIAGIALVLVFERIEPLLS
ncbi:MAG: HupE / UreJ protein [[Chlorobium] sp. 445]|nr:MAG: HupE / UreJ protein [[Chlorobium] sp. 445]